jgi:hypothetical protein
MSAPVFKILIDLDEYMKLLTLKEIVKKQEEEIKKHYETKSAALLSKKEHQILNNSESDKHIELKSGGGGPSNFSFDRSELIRDITAQVAKAFETTYNLQPITPAIKQDGGGADDLLDTTPIPIDLPNSEFAPVEGVEIKKSRLNDDFDLKKLLDGMPAETLSRAEKLVEELQNFPNDITWDSNGTIYIDQHSLPDSNINVLFPKLFRKVGKPGEVLHLKEVASKIASLGFGHLINGRLTNGLNRKKPLLNHDELALKIKAHPNWWYIGE